MDALYDTHGNAVDADKMDYVTLLEIDGTYTLMSYTLARDIGASLDLYTPGGGGGHAAQRMMREVVGLVDPELEQRIEWDSEYGCFFAYVKTLDDACYLKAVIDLFVYECNPDADPGPMDDSPAFIK